MRRLNPSTVAFLFFTFAVVTLTACTAQPARQRGTAYPAPPDVGPSIEPRTVTFADGTQIEFSAFKYKDHSRTVGQAITMLIEPPVEVDDPGAVAQAKFIYEPGPVLKEDLPYLHAILRGYRTYGSYVAYYAYDQRAAEPFTFVVPVAGWQLHLLFPTGSDDHTLSINTGRFDLPLSHHDRQRLITAVGTWQPVYDALGRDALPTADTLAQLLAADAGQARPSVTLHLGESLGAWQVARHEVTYDNTYTTSCALDQTARTLSDTGYRLLATLEPAYLHSDAPTALANRDLQLRLVFEPLPRNAPRAAPLPAPTAVRFGTLRREWRVQPTPDAPNHFAAHLPADSVGDLLGSERTLYLEVTHGEDTHTYTLDTNNLAQVLSHLPDAYYDVETESLP